MKLIPLIAGFAMTYIGYETLTSEPPEQAGWFMIAGGVIFILSAFNTSKGKSELSIELDNSGSDGDGGGD
ncbi:hypothetical protein [Pseudoalteromonas rubra]|uniref:hypothetical protein n=1 Tax=Pseudoalteromonas rubra TaxID=43658 RepID=UPI000F792A94|nr:hypothetical protein [Pseudoalteromonas rubra]